MMDKFPTSQDDSGSESTKDDMDLGLHDAMYSHASSPLRSDATELKPDGLHADRRVCKILIQAGSMMAYYSSNPQPTKRKPESSLFKA